MDKIRPIFDLLKNKNNIQKQGIIDYAAEKLQKIIFTVSEANIPTTKIKNKNSGLQPNVVSKIKEKRKLRREFTKIKIDTYKIHERYIQWEKKLKKVKISSIAEDWKEIKNILGLGKGKLTYSDFIRADGKKAVTDEEKIKLFENTVQQIFCTEIPVAGNLAKER